MCQASPILDLMNCYDDYDIEHDDYDLMNLYDVALVMTTFIWTESCSCNILELKELMRLCDSYLV